MQAAIYGLEGLDLTPSERDFIRDADAAGFILFKRNCDNHDQLLRLTDTLREISGRDDVPILIDQEGGRVARLKPPHWPAYPAPALVAALGGAAAVLEGSCGPCGAGSVTFVRAPNRGRVTLRNVRPGPFAFATRTLGLAILTPSPRGVPAIYRTTDGGRTWARSYASRLLRP